MLTRYLLTALCVTVACVIIAPALGAVLGRMM